MAVLLPLVLLSIAAVARIMGWSVLRVLLLLLVMWLIVFALMLAAPAQEVRAAIGFDVRVWLILGVVFVISAGYVSFSASCVPVPMPLGRPATAPSGSAAGATDAATRFVLAGP